MQNSGYQLTNIVPAAGCCIECRLSSSASSEKIRQKFALAGKSGILYTRDEEEKSSSIHKTDSPSCSFLSLFLSPAVFAGSGAFAFCRCFAAGRIRHVVGVDKICRQCRRTKRKEIKIMTKTITAIPDTKEGIRLLPEAIRNMFQEDMDGKDEGGVYEIKYGDHMFFIPKRMNDGVEAMMTIDKICCRGFSFKRKRKKLISFMRDIWAFAIDEDRREVAGRIEREFAG